MRHEDAQHTCHRLRRGPLETSDPASLEQFIGREGPLHEREAAEWALALALAVREMHAQGNVHGNLSAASVVVRGQRRGVLLHDLAPRRVSYHSPERARTGEISQKDDVYALGRCLHLALTGTLETSGSIPPLSPDALPMRALIEVDPSLRDVLHRALVPQTQKRAASDEFASALTRWCVRAGSICVPALALEYGPNANARALPTLGACESAQESHAWGQTFTAETTTASPPSSRRRPTHLRASLGIAVGVVAIALGALYAFHSARSNRSAGSEPAGALPMAGP
jgi:hypothetical protein